MPPTPEGKMFARVLALSARDMAGYNQEVNKTKTSEGD
jgi:hypothetical protein